MHLRAEHDDLADVLGRATRAVGTRAPVEVLQGILCEVQGNRLRVTGSDLEMTVNTSLEVEVLEEGRAVIPARLAAEAVRKLPPGAVTIRTDEGEVEITGNGPSFRLRQLAVDDFPRLDKEAASGDGIHIAGDELVRAISQVSVAASHDDARPILTGVLFEPNEGALRLAATDSYRLAVRDLPGVEPGGSGLVPVRGLRELGRTIAAEKIGVNVGEREASFSSDRGSLTVRLIEGAFPNYRQLIPDTYNNRLTVAKSAMLDAIDRASLVAEDHIPVRLEMSEGGVDVSVTRQEVGGTAERVEGDYQGEKLTIAFNPRYLSDGVSAIEGDEIVVEVLDGLKPGILRGAGSPEFLYLLMPVRL
ncbi:MAG: DNA polymerase III subunit beta [Acidimicrobiia bacterium]|nr:DNA polymerase III subunit beta [Acidimicrobiia bacterium]